MSEQFLGSYKGFEILANSGQDPLAAAAARRWRRQLGGGGSAAVEATVGDGRDEGGRW
jgi:hypothetical protein